MLCVAGDIMIGYVGFEYPALPNETALERSRWNGWTAAGAKKLFLRPNSLIAGQGLPYSFSTQLAADFRYVAQHGLAATDFDVSRPALSLSLSLPPPPLSLLCD